MIEISFNKCDETNLDFQTKFYQVKSKFTAVYYIINHIQYF